MHQSGNCKDQRRAKGIAFPLFQQALLQQLWLTHPLYSGLTRLEALSPPWLYAEASLPMQDAEFQSAPNGCMNAHEHRTLKSRAVVKQVKYHPTLLIICV